MPLSRMTSGQTATSSTRPRGRVRALWSNLPLRTKGIVVVSIPVAGIVFMAALSYLVNQSSVEVAREQERALDLRTEARGTLISTLEAEDDLRGYLLTGEPGFLDAYEAAVTAMPRHLHRLDSLVGGEPEQEERYRRIFALASERLGVLSQLRQSPQSRRRDLLLDQGRQLSDRLQAVLEAMIAHQDRTVAALQRRADDYRNRIRVLTLVALPLGILGGLLSMLFFTAGIQRRVQRLNVNAGQLARGRALHALPPGEDEIGRLGRALEAAADRLLETRGLLHGVIEGTSDVVYVKDLEGRYQLINPAGAAYLGKPAEEIIGRRDDDFFPPDLLARIEEYDRLIIETGRAQTYETEDVVDGVTRTYLTTRGPFRAADGSIAGMFGISRDITARKQLEAALEERNEELRQLALVDELTGLSNRRGFTTLGEHELRVAARTKQPLAVLFVDLDGLKRINDTLGHRQGDRALREAAAVLRSTLRASDLVARLGGDEFGALLPDCPPDEVEAVLRRLRDHLDDRSRQEPPYDLSLSVGVATQDPDRPASIEDLIDRADRAMYRQRAHRVEAR
jgi:diguanylate cyclase (GGDEF)-like protein/PAS domain S-box-containing protein